MKRFLPFLLAASCLTAGELRGRFQTAAVDVQTDSSVIQQPDLPGFGKTEHIVSISVTTTDENTSQLCINAMVTLTDGTRGGVTRCVDRNTGGPTVIQFSTGEVAPVAFVRLLVTRLHAEAADQLVNTFRRP